MRHFIFLALVALVVGSPNSTAQQAATSQNPAVSSIDLSGQWTTVGGQWKLSPFDFKKSPKVADDGTFDYYISDVKPKGPGENEVWLLGVSPAETMMCTKGTGGPRNCKLPFICAGPAATADQVVVECNVFGQKLELKIARTKK